MEATDRSSSPSDATIAFERALESLILSAYGNGAAIEGDWQVEVPITAAPNWTVSIVKHAGDGEPTYEPRFLTE